MTKKILSLWMILMVLIGLIACDKQPTPEEPISSLDADLSSVSSEIAEEVDNSVEEVASVIESHPAETNPSQTPSATTSSSKEPESVTTSQPSSAEEPSAPDSSGETVSSDAPVASNARPIYDFEGETIDQLLAWIKAEQASKDPNEAVLDENGNLIRELLIPKSTRKELFLDDQILVQSGAYKYYLRTNVSEKNHENESYRFYIFPFSSTNKNWADSVPMDPKLKPYVKSGSYKNLDYIYVDGQKEDDTSVNLWPTVWFVKDGNLINIQATRVNAYKPWNNEWFEYFDYETITW